MQVGAFLILFLYEKKYNERFFIIRSIYLFSHGRAES